MNPPVVVVRLVVCLLLLVTASGCESRADWTLDDFKAQWEKDAALGDEDAAFELAWYRFLDGDRAAAAAEFERLAESDHPNPRVYGMLATLYQSGKGVAVDHERAAYWLEKLAATGDQDAARDLAAYRAHTDSSHTAP